MQPYSIGSVSVVGRSCGYMLVVYIRITVFGRTNQNRLNYYNIKLTAGGGERVGVPLHALMITPYALHMHTQIPAI